MLGSMSFVPIQHTLSLLLLIKWSLEHTGNPFRSERFISVKEDAINNFACVHYIIGKENINLCSNCVRNLANNCIDLQVIQVFSVVGSGIGSVFGSLMLARPSVDYGKISSSDSQFTPLFKAIPSAVDLDNFKIAVEAWFEPFIFILYADTPITLSYTRTLLTVRSLNHFARSTMSHIYIVHAHFSSIMLYLTIPYILHAHRCFRGSSPRHITIPHTHFLSHSTSVLSPDAWP